jgi:hypothetical protein
MREMTVADGGLDAGSAELRRFWAATSGGRTRVEPVYDRYILYGLGLKPMAMIEAYMSVLRKEPGRYRSEPVEAERLARLCAAALGKSVMADSLAKLRQITDAPALAIAAPFPSESDEPNWVRRIAQSGQAGTIAATFRDQCARLAATWSASFLPQPAETLSGFCLMTKPHFSVGRTFLMSDYSAEDDRSHKNAEYGAIVLRAALDLKF